MPSSSAIAQQIGERLYALRHGAGLTGSKLAADVGIGQSKVSRAENGQRLLKADETRRWVEVCGGSKAEADRLVELVVSARVRNPTWADEVKGGQDRVQQAYANLAEGSKRVVYVDPWIVPGPLQTPDYARAVLTMSENMWRKGGAKAETIRRAVHARMSISAMFGDADKQFEFVTSTVPLNVICYLPPSGMLAQVGAMRRALDMGVWLGIIPPGVQRQLLPAGFQMFDDDVRADTGGELVRRSDPDRRKAFETRLEAVKGLCVSGDDAAALLEQLAQQIRSTI